MDYLVRWFCALGSEPLNRLAWVGWEFICSEPILEIGDGIYLGEDKKVQKNNHILIKDNVIPNRKIKWLFRIIK